MLSKIKDNIFTFFFRKGISQSALPYRRSVPTWLKLTPEDCKELIYKLAKKGHTPSQIGNITIFILFNERYICLINLAKLIYASANYSRDYKFY